MRSDVGVKGEALCEKLNYSRKEKSGCVGQGRSPVQKIKLFSQRRKRMWWSRAKPSAKIKLFSQRKKRMRGVEGEALCEKLIYFRKEIIGCGGQGRSPLQKIKLLPQSKQRIWAPMAKPSVKKSFSSGHFVIFVGFCSSFYGCSS